MNEPIHASKISGIKIALAAVPALLIVSVCVALYLGANADKEESRPLEGEVTVEEMAGYLEKLNGLIGERRIDTEEGQRAFRQINAMTMGSLGPANLGYEIFQSQSDSANGLLWPTIWITAGDKESDEIVVVAVPQAESGTGPAFAFGFAEYLASLESEIAIRLVFYPPLVEGDFREWIWERCGSEGEDMRALVKVSGGDSGGQSTSWQGPGGAEGVLGQLAESKLWGGGMRLVPEPGPFFEVGLVEQGNLSRPGHAKQLIELMPVLKELLDRLAR
jgi:hypothetical protein